MKILIIIAASYLWAYLPPMRAAQSVYEDAETQSAATTTITVAPRTLTNYSHALTPTPARARLLNLTLHTVVMLLVCLFMWRARWHRGVIFTVVLLLLLHPISTETLMSLSGRAELIVALGILVTVYAVGEAWWTWRWIALLILGVGITVGGKESGAAVLVLVVPLVAALAIHTARPRWARWWILACLCGVVAIWGAEWRYGGLAAFAAMGGTQINSAFDVTWAEWGLRQSAAVAYWCQSLVQLSLLTVDADIDRLSNIYSVVGGLILVALSLVTWRTHSLGWGLCVATLIPRLLIQTPGSYLNAHQFYMAWVGILLGLGATLQWGVIRCGIHFGLSSSPAVLPQPLSS